MIFLEKLAFSAPDSARIGRPTTRFFAGINRFFCRHKPLFLHPCALFCRKRPPCKAETPSPLPAGAFSSFRSQTGTRARKKFSRSRSMRFCFPLSQAAFLQRGTSKNVLSQRNNSTKTPFRKKARSETGLPEIYFCPPWGPPRTGKTCPLTGACPQGDPRGTSSFTPAGRALSLQRDKLFHSRETSASTPRIP